MYNIVKNALAIIAGLIVGSMINMGIIMVSGSIIPPPEGVDVTSMEGLKAGLALFEPKHFIFPFLAHALGTFFGAFIAGFIATKNKMAFSLAIGVFFLVGGVTNVILLPAPMWFNVVDLVGAYLPVAYLAGFLVMKQKA